MKPVIKIVVAGSILAGGVAWFLASAPQSPVAFIKVVDATGKPVPGAVIKPDGLRPKNNGGHYMWTDRFEVKPLPVTTDSSGMALVPYPHFVSERLETGEISFAIDHPDFCSDRPFRVVSASPPANASVRAKFEFYLQYCVALVTRKVSVRPDPVVLQRGAIVEVSGYLGSRESRVSSLVPTTSASAFPPPGFWTQKEPGVLASRKIPVGTNHLRLVHFKEGGPVCFSDFISFDAKAGQTNRLELELKPGSRVGGRLDDAVPRPVSNGRVIAGIFPENVEPQSHPPNWHVWAPISPDGGFVFDSVPRGRLEIVAICDGFVTENGPALRQTSQRIPQQFVIDQSAQNIVLHMEPSAACEILVQDDQGQPLEGAEVAFWPNVRWNDYSSTIFAGDVFNTSDLLKSPKPPDWSSWNGRKNGFSGVSNEQGIALVRNLPEQPGNQAFMVTHPRFEMPVRRDPGGEASRYAHVALAAGKTNRVTVKLQKPGQDFVTH